MFLKRLCLQTFILTSFYHVVYSCLPIEKGTKRCPGDIKTKISGVCAGGGVALTGLLCVEIPVLGCFLGGFASYVTCKNVDDVIDSCK